MKYGIWMFLTILMTGIAMCCLALAIWMNNLLYRVEVQRDRAVSLVMEAVDGLKIGVEKKLELEKVLKEAQDSGCLVYKIERDDEGDIIKTTRIWNFSEKELSDENIQ